jgi:hypothetical protein
MNAQVYIISNDTGITTPPPPKTTKPTPERGFAVQCG